MNADRVVMTSALVTASSTVGFSAAPKKWGGEGEFPSPRLLVGAALTFFGLSVMAEFAPKVAGPLSVCIAVTAFTYYGMPVLNNAFNTTKKKEG